MRSHVDGTEASGSTTAGVGGGGGVLATVARQACRERSVRSAAVSRSSWFVNAAAITDAFALAFALEGRSLVESLCRFVGAAFTAVIGNAQEGTVAALRSHPASATAARQCEAASGAFRM